METQQVSEAESVREQLQDLQEQIAAHKMAKQEAEAELERQKQVKNAWKLMGLILGPFVVFSKAFGLMRE